MIRYLLLLLALFAFHLGHAQEQYSYMTDRIFKDQLDLYGYNFVPNQLEIPNEGQQDLRKGDYSFGLLGNNLYIDGKDIKGVYSVNNINPTEYGYKLNLMNARDPTIQGHLKVILTQYGHVDALVFKRSTKEKEMIFFLPQIPKNLQKKERTYFTDRWELPLTEIDSLWGKSIHPFLRLHDDQGIQERLQINDSTRVTFVKKVTKVEKKKKGKRKKNKKTESEDIEMENIELGIPDDEIVEEVVEEPTPEPEPEIAPEPTQPATTRTARKRRRFGGYHNTRSYDDEEEETVEEPAPPPKPAAPKPTVEKPDPGASPEVPESTANAPTDSLENDGKEYKIITEYFVNLRTILSYDDGSTEDVNKMYPVKKIIEREDDSAGPDDERYQLEINLKKGAPIYLYLTSERTISSIEVGGKTYLMRGH